MHIVRILLITGEVICAFLLIGIILLQKTKSQGAGLAFGAGVGESLFGAQTGNVLTKATVVLGIIFLINALILSKLESQMHGGSVVDTVPVQVAPTVPAPQADGVPAPMPVGDSSLPVEAGSAPVVGLPGAVETVPVAPMPVVADPEIPADAVPPEAR